MTRFDVRMVLFLIVAFLSVFFVTAAKAEPFQTGEKICYNVKQMGIKAGNATLELAGDSFIEGKKYTLIVFRAQGFNFYDEERIYVDPATWLPQHVLRDLNIFGNKEKISEDYFQADGYFRVTKVAGGKTTVQRFDIKGSVDNIYGFIYRYRLTGKFNLGENFDMQLPTIKINIKFVEALKFKAAGKSYKAMLMKSVPDKYSIWFDTGKNRFPLRIGGAIGLSNTVMTMVECSK